MGDDTETTQTQQTETNPWSGAMPLLNKVISGYSGLDTNLTPEQQQALQTLKSSATGLPNFGSESADAITKIFGTSTAPQVGMLTNAYGDLKTNLGGTASGAELNPYDTPGFSDALASLSGDITNRVKGVYAGAGRDPSGAGSFAGSLGKSLTEGMAPVLADQFNKNKANQMAAANALFTGAGSTATGMSGQQGFELDALLKGIGAQGDALKAFTSPGALQLEAANTAFGLPFANLAQLLNPAVSLGGLGGTSSGSTTQVQQGNLLSDIIGGTMAAASMGKMLFSDERVKEDIEEVGELHDGQKVMRYRYAGSPTFQIGLLAQDVLENEPEAVGSFGDVGILAVDYERATDRAAEIGRMAA